VTLSRLWENMMLIRIAYVIGTPVILSGQTIGVFKDKISKRLAYWGLKKAGLIYLRDPKGSMADLKSIGISGPHVKSVFDDALFCEMSDKETIDNCLKKNGLEVNDRFAVFNVHYWKQKGLDSRQIMKRMAEICDYVVSRYNLRIVFIPMHKSDVRAMEEVQMQMSGNSRMIDYNYDFRITKGIISRAELCVTMKHHTAVFAMGTGVPTIAVVLDDYYYRKNQGTLKLFAQERWIVDKGILFSSGITEKIEDCMNNKKEIEKTIVSRLEAMKRQNGETIKRFANEYLDKERN
jgi:polysaccharide pyruvyl transferase WcaK-like protein